MQRTASQAIEGSHAITGSYSRHIKRNAKSCLRIWLSHNDV